MYICNKSLLDFFCKLIIFPQAAKMINLLKVLTTVKIIRELTTKFIFVLHFEDHHGLFIFFLQIYFCFRETFVSTEICLTDRLKDRVAELNILLPGFSTCREVTLQSTLKRMVCVDKPFSHSYYMSEQLS